MTNTILNKKNVIKENFNLFYITIVISSYVAKKNSQIKKPF